ncbi:MAG: InlB B-repeat-containing protein [Lachnospiraceae bacterium]|nr:InlB B-repeat-containing protein [Lachnospiraceae bacterium]
MKAEIRRALAMFLCAAMVVSSGTVPAYALEVDETCVTDASFADSEQDEASKQDEMDSEALGNEDTHQVDAGADDDQESGKGKSAGSDGTDEISSVDDEETNGTLNPGFADEQTADKQSEYEESADEQFVEELSAEEVSSEDTLAEEIVGADADSDSFMDDEEEVNGSDYFDGTGTPTDPYLIKSSEDWDTFAELVNNWNGFSGKTFKLTNDISVSTVAGRSDKEFRGTFNGDGHTINLVYSSNYFPSLALFPYVQGATIKCLNVTGSLTTKESNAGGLVGTSEGVTILNCRSGINIISNETYLRSMLSGGLIGNAKSSSFTIINSLFDGKYDRAPGTGTFPMSLMGGLVGTDVRSTPYVENCLNAGTFYGTSTDISKIARVGGRGKIVNCYSTIDTTTTGTNADDRGIYTEATGEDLRALLGPGWEVLDGKVVPVMDTQNLGTAMISGISSDYLYNGEAIDIDYIVTDAMDRQLDDSEYYATITKNGIVVDEIVEPGIYNLTVSAKDGSGYTGAQRREFQVVGGDGLDTDLSNATLTGDFVNASSNTYYYNGAPADLNYSVFVKDKDGNNVKLIKGVNYTAYYKKGSKRFEKITEDGDYQLVITGIEPFTGTLTNKTPEYIKARNALDINNVGTVGFGTTVYLKGEPLVPQVTLIMNYQLLTEGEQYKLVVTRKDDGSAVDAFNEDGVYILAVEGLEPYFGTKILSSNYTVKDEKELKNSTVSGVKDFYLLGDAPITIDDIDYSVKALNGKEALVKGTDYTDVITKEDGTQVDSITEEGLYTLTVSAKEGSGYKGFKSCDLRIKKNSSLASATVSGVRYAYVYTGQSIRPEYTVESADGTPLIKGTDYDETITFEGRKVNSLLELGEYELTISPSQGSAYTGTQKITTSVAPIVIDSEETWNNFADAVTNGTTYEDVTVHLTNDISVRKSAGDINNKFRGTFEGDGHTITIDMVAESNVYAPFRYIENATIAYLKVDGAIEANGKQLVGGLFGRSYGNSTIKGCQCSVTVNGSGENSGYYGGVCGGNYSGTLHFIDCLFDGSINCPISIYSGGFLPNYSGKVFLDNCYMSGGMNMNQDLKSGIFSSTYYASSFTMTDCYYAADKDYEALKKQGVPTSAKGEELRALLGPGWMVSGDSVVPVMDSKNLSIASVTGSLDSLYSTGSALDIEYTVRSADGKDLEKGTHYTETIKLNGTPIDDVILAGKGYTLTIDAIDGSGYTGSLTIPFEVKPAYISSADDWDHFVEKVNGGLTYDGVTVTLASDIEVSKTVGTAKTPFKGTFNGNGHTITLDLTSEGEYCAPFAYVDGATITRLHTAGTITASSKKAAGLIGQQKGKTTVMGCRSSVVINSSISGEGSHGGFVASNESDSTINFNNCLFDGKLLTDNGTGVCAGFVGAQSGTVLIANSLYDPAVIGDSETEVLAESGSAHSCTFVCYDDSGITNSYYTRTLGEAQGTEVGERTVEQLVGDLGSGWIISEGKAIPDTSGRDLDTAVIGGILNEYHFYGSFIPEYTVTASDGTALKKGTHYKEIIKKDETEVGNVDGIGDYSLTIEAIDGGGYTGFKTVSFRVTLIDTWDKLQKELDEKGYAKLTGDITAGESDVALTVKKNATLDLNGHILDRGLSDKSAEDHGYVIRAYGNGVILTVIDSDPNASHTGTWEDVPGGIITGGNNTGFGGGISLWRMASVVINGGTIAGNHASSGGGIGAPDEHDDSNSGVGDVTLTGGKIINNTADIAGGGVYFNPTHGYFYISGNPVILQNTVNGEANNAYLGKDLFYKQDTYFYVTGKLTEGALIGFSTEETSDVVFSRGWENMINIDPDPYFVSDAPGYNIECVRNTSSFTYWLWKRGTNHHITVMDSEHGNVTTDASADVGQTVTLSVDPDEDYHLDEIHVTWKDYSETKELELTQTHTYEYTFVMPNGNVTVTYSFAKGAQNTTIYDLIDLFADGGTLKLTADIKTDDALKMSEGKTAVLDLNGHIIDRGLNAPVGGEDAGNYDDGFVFLVDKNADLTIIDSDPVAAHDDPTLPKGGIITGGYANYYGGGIRIKGGTLTQKAGTIYGNRSCNYGGGVMVGSRDDLVAGGINTTPGVFNMEGGMICGNEAQIHEEINSDSSGRGGGVFVMAGTFNMSGGTISGNIAQRNGAGVILDGNIDYCRFNLSGGVIRDNDGFGVELKRGKAVVSGGTVSGNKGGIYYYGNELSLSGTPDISNNTIIEGDIVKDVDLMLQSLTSEYNRVKITDALNPVNPIGVCVKNESSLSETVPVTFTAGMNGNGSPTACFKYYDPDNGRIVADDNGEAAIMKAKTHAIRYNLNGGTLAEGKNNPESYYVTTPAFKLNNPTRPGYIFAGWSCEQYSDNWNFDKIIISWQNPVVDLTVEKGELFDYEHDLKFTANWTPITYTAHFDANFPEDALECNTKEGSLNDRIYTYDKHGQVDVSQRLPEYDSVNCVGYVFDSWNTKADGSGQSYKYYDYYLSTDALNLTTEDGGEVTLYGIWTAKTITLELDGNGGVSENKTYITIQNFEYGKKLPANPFTREHYDFRGWNTKADGSGTSYADMAPILFKDSTSITLYAQWQGEGDYTVHFEADAVSGNTVTGKMDDITHFKYGDIVKLPKNDYSCGINVIYEYNGADGGEMPEKTVVPLAFKNWKYAPNEDYCVTFNDEQELVVASGLLKIFEGVTPTLKAQWEERGYFKLPAPTKTGYEFGGWYTDKELTDRLYPNNLGEYSVTQSVTLYAKWTIKKYYVNFYDAPDNLLRSIQVEYGKRPVYPADAALPGRVDDDQYSYTFAGWKDKDGTLYGVNQELPVVTGDADYTVYFTTTLRRHSVNFYDWNGSVLKGAAEYDYGTKVKEIISDPTRAADAKYTYTFDGWDLNGEVYASEGLTVTKAATYWAHYKSTLNKYKVTFVDDDGTTVLKETVAYDYGTSANMIVKPATPTKAADETYTYTFKGWKSDGDEVYKADELPAVTADVTYKAVYDSEKKPDPKPEPKPEPEPEPEPTPDPTVDPEKEKSVEPISVSENTVNGVVIRTISVNYAVAVKQKIDLSAVMGTHKKYVAGPKGSAKVNKKKKIVTVKKAGNIVISAYDKVNKTQVLKEEIHMNAVMPVLKNKTVTAMELNKEIDGAANIEDGALVPTRWESSKPQVATVDPKTGAIMPLSKGKTNITVYYGEGKNAAKVKFKVKVN